jgi:hypothetical protein
MTAAAIAQAMPNAGGVLVLLLAFGAVFRVWLQGFSTLVTSLQAAIDRALAAHASCEDRLAKLEGELAGLRRQTIERSLHEAVPIGRMSPEVTAAAMRVKEIMERQKGDES